MAAILIKCLFCDHDCRFVHRDIIFEEDIWSCDNCPKENDVAIHVHNDGHKGAELTVVVNREPYKVSMWHPLCPLRVTAIDKDGNITTVLKFNFTPDWNPANIEMKLRQALPFL